MRYVPAMHIVIVGGGFGGLLAARGLSGMKDARITLIDRTNHHLFQPLLYQVAMAGLSPADIAVPIRAVLHNQKNVAVRFAEVERVDLAGKRLHTTLGEEPYDKLIIAAGAVNSYFGHDAQWAQAAPGLKSLDDAVEIRKRVLLALELAEQEPDEATRKALLTFVVIGGGPTGVELAGALSELSRYIVARDFRRITYGQIRVILVEGGPAVLSTFKADLQQSAVEQLHGLGVEVRTSTKVLDINENAVITDQDTIVAHTVLWGAGVKAAPLAATLGVPLDRAGRIVVGADLHPVGYPDVFIVGDIAACTDAKGKPVPGVAPSAMQMGKFAARQIKKGLNEQFSYKDKGSLATIGRSAAVAQFGQFGFGGFIAWLMWMAIHILFLVGFRNRYVVMFQWMWYYLSFERGARLITQHSVAPRQPAPLDPGH